MSLKQPDLSTIRKAKLGDEYAFAELVSEYEVMVYNYVSRMLGDPALAEDLTQEIFLRVHGGISNFSLRSRFTTWLFQIAKNRVFDELRSRERRLNIQDKLENSVRGVQSIDAPIEENELIAVIWEAIALLNADLKTALLMRDVLGFSYGEIAESLEITISTVKWRIYKAREDVLRTLEDRGVKDHFLPLRESKSLR